MYVSLPAVRRITHAGRTVGRVRNDLRNLDTCEVSTYGDKAVTKRPTERWGTIVECFLASSGNTSTACSFSPASTLGLCWASSVERHNIHRLHQSVGLTVACQQRPGERTRGPHLERVVRTARFSGSHQEYGALVPSSKGYRRPQGCDGRCPCWQTHYEVVAGANVRPVWIAPVRLSMIFRSWGLEAALTASWASRTPAPTNRTRAWSKVCMP